MEAKDEVDDSDVDVADPNFKGIYFGDKTEKYTDPLTGAHFEFNDFCQRLVKLKEVRRTIDKRLGISTSSKVLSPNKNRKENPKMIDTKDDANAGQNLESDEVQVKMPKIKNAADS